MWIRNIKWQFNSWAILTFVFVLLILLPNLSVFAQLFTEPNENWYHIKEYLLKSYVINSLTLVFFTALFTILIGVSLAWFVSAFEFPLKNFFKWGMVLPLSIPPYIGAYTYHGILNYTGVIQSELRNSFDISVEQKYFDIMTMPGAIFIFTMFLFPYVYIITKSFLEKQAASLVENARLLGSNSFEIFYRVIIPISRTAIIGGVSLVILEVLNDYGVVKYFGIQTFSTAIFQAWFGMGDHGSAVRLAGILMSIVIVILVLEKLFRGRRKYSFSTSKVRPIQKLKLTGIKGFGMSAYFFIVFSFAFLIPLAQLALWAFMTYDIIFTEEFYQLVWNSVFVALIAAILIVVAALIIGNYTRLSNGRIAKAASKVTILGYSMPGAVIAIGVITIFIGLDRKLFPVYEAIGLQPTLILSLSISMLIFAYVIRFLAIGYNSIESGFDKVGQSFTEASRTLGMSVTQSFFKVDLKMIKGAVAGGFILVFVDILKELPLTLILQPFNFYTLATKAFQYASDEMIQEASIPSLFIIMISGLSIFLFHKILEKEPS
ncbi:ABC transporter permease [Mesobacillus harenae]|uniref:ABC transporter permease n=1 Tax=Mesobacillus harenae TaxID=2213203 RepID=UPI00157FBFFE|nr:iron ABC transporter permease [Mesobacillus harenae]